MQSLNREIERAEREGLKRELSLCHGKDFISNDYLGLTRDLSFHKILKNAVDQFDSTLSGNGGSRLLGGNKEFCEEVEERLAQFSNAENALFFPSGYQANVSLMSSLVREKDVVLSDEYNHASLIDGIRLSKGEKIVYKHNDIEELEKKLWYCQGGYENIFITCESLYSMEGTHAPLQKISELAQKYEAKMIVDESHATGLFGPNGSGLVNSLDLREKVFCTVHTAGKALGVAGAWIAGSNRLKQYLVNFARGFIYSTAPSPVQFLFVDESVQYLKTIPGRRVRVLSGARWLRKQLEELSVEIGGDNSPIIPIILGDNEKVATMSSQLKEKSFSVAGIRYPTVPRGKARLRISVNHTNLSFLEELATTFGEIA